MPQERVPLLDENGRFPAKFLPPEVSAEGLAPIVAGITDEYLAQNDAIGARWYETEGVPAPALGASGDWAIDITTSDAYVKVDGVWTFSVSIKGEDSTVPGPPGPSTELTVGTVTTLPPGSLAEVEIVGESPSQTLNFSIPEGEIGDVTPEALAARDAAIAAETGAETAQASAETAASNAALSATAADASAGDAAGSATAAATSEANAAASETAAGASATSAATSATAAETARTGAETAETNAETALASTITARDATLVYRDSAATSATSASDSASTATTQASNAATSAAEADASAAAAAQSAIDAENAAGGGVLSVNGESGNVILDAVDVGARPAGDVPWTEVSGKPTTFPPDVHGHTAAQITGLAAVATSGSASDITTGTLPTSVLPPLAINETFTAGSQAEMLALTAQRGDMCIRTDVAKTYVLATDSPSTLADWKEFLATGQVTSVAGKTGVVMLNAADVGALPDTYVPTWTEITGKPATFPPDAHNHDDLYFTEAEVTSALATNSTNDRARANHTGTQAISTVSGLQTALDGKAASVHTHDDRYYTEGETNTLLAGKAASSHTHAIADLPVATSGTSNSTQLVRADDSRLSDARTPTAHTHDDRYYTETESDSRFVQIGATGQSVSGKNFTSFTSITNNAAGATDIVAEFFNDLGPVRVRFHNPGEYYYNIRADGAGFALTGGDNNGLASLAAGQITGTALIASGNSSVPHMAQTNFETMGAM